MRPRDFSEFVGQPHLFGKDGGLARFAAEGRLFSMILTGPPGTGKSAFASLLAETRGAEFVKINAVTSNIADLKQVIAAAAARLLSGRKTLLFIDEIHRFNRTQQDALLPAVEDGTVFLVGVTTENPGFSVNPALLSRCHRFDFRPLDEGALAVLLDWALTDPERGLGAASPAVTPDARGMLLRAASGDGRRLLNLLEITAAAARDGVIDEAIARDCLSGQTALYDHDGDAHYDVVSAFIKSMRGSDPDATLLYLARMLEGGEDPRFIMRRILIAASEDVGLADSGVLVVAAAAATAVEMVGLPEAALILSHAALRVALAPKSNSATLGIAAARASLREQGTPAVPEHLRDAHAAANRAVGRGKDYLYPHDFPRHFIEQAYQTRPAVFYTPGELGSEAGYKKWLDFLHGRA
jgi:putative ATPase